MEPFCVTPTDYTFAMICSKWSPVLMYVQAILKEFSSDRELRQKVPRAISAEPTSELRKTRHASMQNGKILCYLWFLFSLDSVIFANH